VCPPPRGGVAEDGGQEWFPSQFIDRRVGNSDDTRRAGNGAQQRDLSHAFAAAAVPQQVAILHHVELAGGDGIVRIAFVALADENPPAGTSTGASAAARPSSAGAARLVVTAVDATTAAAYAANGMCAAIAAAVAPIAAACTR
jgi:hypothetical protein